MSSATISLTGPAETPGAPAITATAINAAVNAALAANYAAFSPVNLLPLVEAALDTLPTSSNPAADGLAVGAYYWANGALAKVQP